MGFSMIYHSILFDKQLWYMIWQGKQKNFKKTLVKTFINITSIKRFRPEKKHLSEKKIEKKVSIKKAGTKLIETHIIVFTTFMNFF